MLVHRGFAPREKKLDQKMAQLIGFFFKSCFSITFSCPDNRFHLPTLTAHICIGCVDQVWYVVSFRQDYTARPVAKLDDDFTKLLIIDFHALLVEHTDHKVLFESILFQFEEYLFKVVRHCKGRTDILLQYNFSKQQRSHSRSLRDHINGLFRHNTKSYGSGMRPLLKSADNAI